MHGNESVEVINCHKKSNEKVERGVICQSIVMQLNKLTMD